MITQNGIVLIGHGSRLESLDLVKFAQKLQKNEPNHYVNYGFLELQEPSAYEALTASAKVVKKTLTIIPMFLFQGGHVKNDLPLLGQKLKKDFPHLNVQMAPPLGESPVIVEIAKKRLSQKSLGGKLSPKQTVFLALARGTSHPDANASFSKMTRLIAESVKIPMAFPCFSGVAKPSLKDMITLATRLRPKHVILLPYLLAPGIVLRRAQEAINKARQDAPWITWHHAEHLGLEDPMMLSLVQERLAQTLHHQPLPCMHCQYRPSWTMSVDPTKALLWSVRHTLVNGEASPHEHAHPPLCKHVLVCVNADCASRGSVHVLNAMREHIKSIDQSQKIKVTRTLCLGRCGEGPTVAVYPDGIWYRGVQVSDVDELVTEHLLGDRPLQKRLDGIMHIPMEY